MTRLSSSWCAILACLFLAWFADAKKVDPVVSKTTLDGVPSELFYFDDTDTILIHDAEASNVFRSSDAGASWDRLKDVPENGAWKLIKHPYDNKIAYVFGIDTDHWITRDQGETWQKFSTESPPSLSSPLVSFHAADSSRVLYHASDCEGWTCKDATYYTTNGFETTRKLRDSTRMCIFAQSTNVFDSGIDAEEEDRIICVVEGKYSPLPKDFRLVVSDNYFIEEVEPLLDSGRTVPGVINMAAVKKFIVAAAKAENTDELALYVTSDAKTWHRAEFPAEHKLEQDAYTILESTNYSIQLDVMTTRPLNPMGVLFTSNSNGTYFTRNVEHTNRNILGLVDFEKVQGIHGIVLVNTVENWKEVEDTIIGTDRKIQSRISFDDGRTFQNLKVGKDNLHLHSVTEMRNSGRIFSSPAPGLVMGVGNTGEFLKPYKHGDLYVSDDAGLTWRKALDEPHIYEFGDQGSVLVAIKDTESTSKVKYSINHGKDWESLDLDEKVRAMQLSTTPDSTSLKFVLIADKGTGSKVEHEIISLDFEGLHERKCGEKDFEKWYARLDEEGKPDCLMGHKEYYLRRKPDADCFIDEEFKDPVRQYEVCKCTEEDFECDYNFVRSGDRTECLPVARLSVPEGECKSADDTFKGSSGWRLIPGDHCDIRMEGSVDKEKPVDRPCRDTVKVPASGEVSHEPTTFDSNSYREYYYLERTETSHGEDETIILRTDQQDVFITHDHGKTWEEILKGESILAIYPHRYFNDYVFFITGTKKVFYSTDRGYTIHEFEAPVPPNTHRLQIIGFHPQKKDWLIWTGSKGCDGFGTDCHAVAYYSTSLGDEWHSLLRYVRKCQFVADDDRAGSEELVYCEQFKDENPDKPLQLIASENWFQDSKIYFDDIVDFATMSEFIIVAAKDEDQKTLKVDASVDGKTFADALFPPNFRVPHQQAYTVLDSSTHSVFLHVTVNTLEDHEYGSIIKSNSNGTSYVLSLSAVNRNRHGYVDFEKMQGLDGVAIVNIVDNAEGATTGEAKKLKSMITHNDGAEWSFIDPPAKDADGTSYDCKGDIQKCSLHLHGYTERKDPRDTFSSPSAVGLMMAVGNVGEYLGRYKDGDTFITSDGGITWSAAKKGTYMWEYGDQGSIIVIVSESTPTDVVFYTLDEGKNWREYKFTEGKMLVEDISTVPSDNSRNFLLWGKETSSGSDKFATVNLDFTGLSDTQCFLNEDDPEDPKSDYYLWEPKHPLQEDNCLFGHVARYHRKKPDAVCFNGKKIQHLHEISRNCTCTRQDFECDYNYELENDGACRLIKGLPEPDHSQYCAANPEAVEFYEPTGYRRIPLSTCQGGRELELTGQVHPCPGREEDFKKKRKGISGVGLFFAITVPFAVATGIGYWVWRNWDGKFGRIRLGESGPSFDTNSPWVTYPVAALSGFVAVLAAIPLLAASLWRSVAGRFGRSGGQRTYTTRSSFARGRHDYAVVDTDEGELLGDESDEDV
ncbi:vacuolar protein sorting protein [Xylona heveae TC161]|uniref:Vacuolar protein sorting/targeting protein 10 n=1 Tax=Xylona heveae (strain CBS 132557 / TC161) TaxID=1328760 RepID=A0A165HNP1_XYLHT|nr:vacuolar protein sorting protein [Xylona heveae TC161]KZF23780.1 vacuolar protein sorting protein [Xylona heveae TC161]